MLSLNKFLNRTSSTILNVYFSLRLLHGECLNNRSLVKVCGQKTNEFLQGLITNDIQHLNNHVSSMYTMFLNVQGRVLFDVIIYKTNEGSYIIDCDSQIVEPLINHMKFYKMRRKIKFEKLDSLQVWVVFDDDVDLKKLTVTDLESFYLSPQNKSVSHFKSKVDLPNQAIVSRDPRLKYLGVRIILPAKSLLKDYSNISLANESYQKLRFKLGIGEGVHDLARGKCLPLEVNCDYLHGVSFQKGCYIGQELTARTYHTGVIRKRFMPLIFERDHSVEKNTIVTNEKGKNVGKVISTSGDYGIGLLRVVEALAAQSLNVGQYTVKTFKPGWWPIEVSKDS